ncbi:MAG: ATP-binding protein [Clostridia bacterium]|nr:ATP-binding protein [Clostridia bacterium]
MLKLKIYKTKIPSDINIMCATINEILRYLQSACEVISEDTLFEVKVILNELILNAIKHGNQEMGDRFVKIAAAVTKSGRMFLVIEDEGQGYDYKCIAKNAVNSLGDEDSCEMKVSGRGLIIVANLSEKLRLNKKGNRIVILKRLLYE